MKSVWMVASKGGVASNHPVRLDVRHVIVFSREEEQVPRVASLEVA